MNLRMLKSNTFLLVALACSLVALGGCGGPQLSDAEIGKPVFELPKLPGSDKPYPDARTGQAGRWHGPRKHRRGTDPSRPKNPASAETAPAASVKSRSRQRPSGGNRRPAGRRSVAPRGEALIWAVGGSP